MEKFIKLQRCLNHFSTRSPRDTTSVIVVSALLLLLLLPLLLLLLLLLLCLCHLLLLPLLLVCLFCVQIITLIVQYFIYLPPPPPLPFPLPSHHPFLSQFSSSTKCHLCSGNIYLMQQEYELEYTISRYKNMTSYTIATMTCT